MATGGLKNLKSGVAQLADLAGVYRLGSTSPTTTGQVYFVHSGIGAAGNDGLTPDTPLATIASALEKCAASQGDLVLVMPGHAETLTTPITCSRAGVTIFGLGEGTARPELTVGAAIDGINITADNVTIENLHFNLATAAATANINVAAAQAKLRRLHMDCGTYDIDAITVTAAGELLTVEECTVRVVADGPDSFIKFEDVVDRPVVRNCIIIGSDGTHPYDDGVFDFDSVAVTNPFIYDNLFNGGGVATVVIANGGAVDADNIGGGAANLTAVTDALYGIAGIASYPAAAAPANNVSLAEVLRSVWNVLRNGTGGLEPGTNRSIIDEVRGAALNYNAINYLAVPVNFATAGWNEAATHEVFTVTGLVRVRIVIACTGDVDSAGHGATIAFGDEVAQTWIGATDETELDTGDLWYDTTPTTSQDTFANVVLDRVVNGLDLGYLISTEALTVGGLVFHCWWEPLNATGAVVAGSGGAL